MKQTKNYSLDPKKIKIITSKNTVKFFPERIETYSNELIGIKIKMKKTNSKMKIKGINIKMKIQWPRRAPGPVGALVGGRRSFF